MEEALFYTDGSAKDEIAGIGIVAFRVAKLSVSVSETEIIRLDHYESVKGKCNHQRAELLAIMVALESLPKTSTWSVQVYSDSDYSIKCCTEYITTWKLNGFKTAAKKDVKNQDIIMRIDSCMQLHNVHFIHVPAHSGIVYNEVADKLAERGRLENV
ncbi:MAG: putative ribonuclease H1-like protein [Solivirus sp.]|uniref:ribonuclease H n=1 Tax=Solivirus sp. TaxID=2487772 RepID=A0A3G5AJV1_9VIRU|nr:MAG: putative ribonuclease H1-like protein [Solivirus sp.]